MLTPKAKSEPSRPAPRAGVQPRTGIPSSAPRTTPLHRLAAAPVRPRIQRVSAGSLALDTPGDRYEREADRVAEQVLQMPTAPGEGGRPTPLGKTGAGGPIQRNMELAPEDDLVASDSEPVESLDAESAAEEEEAPVVQTKAQSGGAGGGGLSGGGLARGLRQTSGGGQPLDAATRQFMEPRFGFDFSSVRVHHDRQSDRMSRGISAAAFTHGHDVYFRSGRYAPSTSAGKRLLAHELTHVVQQSGGSPENQPSQGVQRSLERPATPQISPLSTGAIQRKPEVEVKLSEPNRVRIIDGGKETKRWNTVSAGKPTLPLMKKSPYTIYEKRKPTDIWGKWGLTYFAMFKGGYGFHSNIAMKRQKDGTRKKIKLTVDGKLRSHGCIRMFHSQAKEFYNSISKGTKIHLLKDFSSKGSGKSGSAKKPAKKKGTSGSIEHTVVSGDTLSKLASDYDVSEAEIKKANPGKVREKDSMIRKGDVLIIPKKK